MNPKTLFGELRRRNVLKVATTYAALAWLLTESASFWLSRVGAPAGVITGIVVLLALGFILIIYISWAFEATPEGMKRTRNISPDASLPTWSRRKFATFIIAVAVLAASLHLLHSVQDRSASPSPAAAIEAHQ